MQSGLHGLCHCGQGSRDSQVDNLQIIEIGLFKISVTFFVFLQQIYLLNPLGFP